MPRVLFVVTDYPPGYLVGYTRVAAFEKYLPQFGFDTAVLTIRSYGARPDDRQRHVYRAWDAGCLYLPLTHRFLPSARLRAPAISAASAPPLWRRILHRLLGTVRAAAMNLLVPDLRIFWLPPAVILGRRVIKAEAIDLICSSSPDETTHLVAGLLARQTGKPWVADFRDGWLFDSLKPQLQRDGRRRRLEQHLERWVAAGAAAVTTVSDPITDYFRKTYADQGDKFHTVTNGYDPDDWQGVVPRERQPGRLRLVYTGMFQDVVYNRPGFDPRPFWRALTMLPPEARAELEVVFVGRLAGPEPKWIEELGVGDVVRLTGQVSKAESLAYQLSADVLLLLAGTFRSYASLKLYEYLYAGRPILALSAPDTAAAEIIRRCEAGEVVDPADCEAIAAALLRYRELWRGGTLAAKTHGIEIYDRREVAARMAAIFSRILAARSAAGTV